MHAHSQPSTEGGSPQRLDATARARRDRGDRELFARYHRTGDKRDRDAIVERFMPLARRLAGRYNRRADSLDDLTQVAALALVKAVDRFDPTRGIAFSSYAVPTIVGEIKRHFRDHGWAVRPPRALAEQALRVEAAARQFAVEHHHAPTVAELCARTELTEEEVLDALHAGRAANASSLDAPVSKQDEGATSLGERMGADDDGYGIVEQRVLLEGLMRGVSPRDREILHMRYFEDMTQAEIGAAFGVSQMQVSRLVRSSIERMQLVAEAQAGRESVMSQMSAGAGRRRQPAPGIARPMSTTPEERPLALVTGASSGIGYELARQFADHGFDLIVTAEDAQLAAAARHLRDDGAQVTAVRTDLSTASGVDELYDAVRATGRPLAAAALNAGVGAGGAFATDTDLADELRIVDLNVRCTVHLAKHVVRDMVARDEGRILFTSSIASTMPGAFQAVYNASKSFVQSFALALREELKDTGVTVTSLMPGPTDTEFFARADMLDTKVGAGPKDDPPTSPGRASRR